MKQVFAAPVYLSDVQLAARYSVVRQSIWRWARVDPKFPRPVEISPGTTRWAFAEILAWEETRARRGASLDA